MDSQLSFFFRFSSIIEAMPDSLVIVDSNGRIILINGQTERLFEYPRSELLGEHVEQLMPHRYRNKHVHYRNDYFSDPKVRAMASELELFGMKKHGAEFPIEISLSPLKTEEGTFTLAAVRDITVRKKIEAKFKSLLESTPDGLVVVNNEGKIVLVNHQTEKLFGHQQHEIVGKDVEFLIPPRFHGNHIHHRHNYFSSSRERPMGAGLELFGQHKKGHEFPVEISLSPLETEDGMLALAAIRDVSEQKQLKEQLQSKNRELEKQNRLKNDFLANMSHDIRTPLTGVIGMAQILQDVLSDPNQQQYAQWLGESGKQLLNMLNEILNTVTEEKVNDDLHEENFELRKIIQEIFQLERPSTITKNIDLKIHIDEEVPAYLFSDPTKIRRILLNLIGNAIKFTQKGEIKIGVQVLKKHKTNALLRFSVADTGTGIPYELQDKVFEKFFRDQSANAGHGLGLHIAQSYAHLLGGTILLTSEPDVGTTFYVDLLLKIGTTSQQQPSAAKKKSHLPTKTKHQTSTNSPKFLLVEDNHIALVTLENTVQQAGFRHVSAVDGERALELVKSELFDVIVTDVGLPGLSGLELAKKIREYENNNSRKPTLIIGLTAHTEDKIKNECIKAGMNDAFTKPINSETLAEINLRYLVPAKPQKPQEKLSTANTNNAKLEDVLPHSEKELLQLDDFPLLDAKIALSRMGNDTVLLQNSLQYMLEKEIPENLSKLKEAYAGKDWATIEKVAHKLRGGVIYCGAIKLAYACQYLEQYPKSGNTELLEPLYQQLFAVVAATIESIQRWLSR